jgi:hypothetical protein
MNSAKNRDGVDGDLWAQVEVQREDVQLGGMIGWGAAGQVFEGEYFEEKVAVKQVQSIVYPQCYLY